MKQTLLMKATFCSLVLAAPVMADPASSGEAVWDDTDIVHIGSKSSANPSTRPSTTPKPTPSSSGSRKTETETATGARPGGGATGQSRRRGAAVVE